MKKVEREKQEAERKAAQIAIKAERAASAARKAEAKEGRKSEETAEAAARDEENVSPNMSAAVSAVTKPAP